MATRGKMKTAIVLIGIIILGGLVVCAHQDAIPNKIFTPSVPDIPHYQQTDDNACGVTCLKMLLEYYGEPQHDIAFYNKCADRETGQKTTLDQLISCGESLGYDMGCGCGVSYETLKHPSIALLSDGYEYNHWVVMVYTDGISSYINDPLDNQTISCNRSSIAPYYHQAGECALWVNNN